MSCSAQRLRRLIWLQGILYLVPLLLMPTVHLVVHAAEPHELPRCERCEKAGPALHARCDGPCSDPDHHHHSTPAHPQHPCVLCKVWAGPQDGARPDRGFRSNPPRAVPLVPEGDASPVTLFLTGTDCPRPPPAVS